MNRKIETQEKQNKIKIVFLGERAVGKSSIIKRYVKSQFDETIKPTIGVDFMKKIHEQNGKKWRIQIWDTAGQQKFRSLVKGYMKGADICIFVYDNTNINSLMNLPQWFSIFDNACDVDSSCLVACNKNDLKVQQNTIRSKEIFKERSKQMKKYQQMQVSAKTGQNIEQLFDVAIKSAIQKYTQKRKPLSLVQKQNGSNLCCFN